MKKNLLLLLFAICGLAINLHAQKAISGKISDEAGNGIPSASIVEKGTTKGTISDFDGNFKLDASAGATLIVSFVGYTSQ
jgi:hypothetical protein